MLFDTIFMYTLDCNFFYLEAFSQWLEEKVDLPLLEDLSTTTGMNKTLSGETKFPQQFDTTDFIQQDTESLLREFERIYDKVELNHFTPPQSPTSLFYTQPEQCNEFNHLDSSPDWDKTFGDDVEVDICQRLYEQNDFDMLSLEQQSTEDVIPMSEESDIADQIYDHFYESSFTSEDKTISSPDNSSSLSSDQDDDWVPDQSSTKHSYKLYHRLGRGDRKNRKKEQNKNAATRYRQKKKAQIEEIISKEQDLLEYNKKLRTQCTDIEREIKYLKDLMRELFKAKGLLK